jgi:hypothetical protein
MRAMPESKFNMFIVYSLTQMLIQNIPTLTEQTVYWQNPSCVGSLSNQGNVTLLSQAPQVPRTISFGCWDQIGKFVVWLAITIHVDCHVKL